jgi:predicted alternative tryptophan synthase beta-subunit
VEVAAQDPEAHFLGSVLNHVLLHQTVIGLEAIEQMELAGDYPDVIVGCTGGGSNFAGIAFPFIGRKLRGGGNLRVLAVEPSACPSLTRGRFAYDFGDTAHLTPLVKMHTLGSTFVPAGIHAGGLRYHGMAPLVSHLLILDRLKQWPCTNSMPLLPECNLLVLREFCPLPKPITPWQVPFARRCAARKRVAAGRFCLIFVARPLRHASLHRLRSWEITELRLPAEEIASLWQACPVWVESRHFS